MVRRLSEFLLDLYRGSREMPITVFQDWVFERLQIILPFDSGIWAAGYLDGDDPVIHSLQTYKQSRDFAESWMSYKDEDPLVSNMIAMPGKTINVATQAAYGGQPFYDEFYKPNDIAHILCTGELDPHTALYSLILLHRENIAEPFSEDERIIKESLMPHLVETYRLNRMNYMEQARQPSGMTHYSVGASDEGGRMHLVEPAFTKLMLDEWPEWHGPKLPDNLSKCLVADEGRFSGEKSIIKFTRLNDLFLLRGRRRSNLDNLSDRERQIAEHFSLGLTYKQIAQMLQIAPSTVRNHLNAIYLKLRVNNKTDMVTILKMLD